MCTELSIPLPVAPVFFFRLPTLFCTEQFRTVRANKPHCYGCWALFLHVCACARAARKIRNQKHPFACALRAQRRFRIDRSQTPGSLASPNQTNCGCVTASLRGALVARALSSARAVIDQWECSGKKKLKQSQQGRTPEPAPSSRCARLPINFLFLLSLSWAEVLECSIESGLYQARMTGAFCGALFCVPSESLLPLGPFVVFPGTAAVGWKTHFPLD